MRISIAMATYNGSPYIQQQLKSLAAQTVLPYELVVTDDGSTDETLAIVEAFAVHAPFPVHIHRNARRLNFADNFLHAASLCKGDWIAFCDQDDVWLKDKLEHVSGEAHGDVSMIVHRVQIVDADLQPIPGAAIACHVRRGPGPQRLPPMGYFSGLCITFNAALLGLLLQHPRFPDANNPAYEAAHDRWVSTIADTVGRVCFISKPLVLYRQHGANACGATTGSLGMAIGRSGAPGSSTYQQAAMLAQNYSDCFEMLAASAAGTPWQARLQAGAQRYRATRDYLAARSVLYGTSEFSGRMWAWAKMCLKWSYRFNPVRAPLLAVAKDLRTVLFKTV
jgi:hypothetical protein